MCCNFPAIKITEGNAFTLIFPLKRRSYVAERPIDKDIDVTRLSNVHVTLGGVEYAPTIETYGVRIDVPATLVRGTYDGLLTADYDGNAIRGAYESCVQIVAWNAQSNAQQYILGSPVATKAAYVLGYMPTDAEVDALKQQLREQIAAAEQAEAEALAEKKRYAEALEHLDDIAKQGYDPEVSLTSLSEIIEGLDISQVAKQGSDSTATNTAIRDKVDEIIATIGGEADVNAVYLELLNRQTYYQAEGFPGQQDLPHLPQAVAAFTPRKISNGSAPSDGIPDGISLAHLLCSTDAANSVTEIVDDNYGWTMTKAFSIFPNTEKILLGCSEIVRKYETNKALYSLSKCKSLRAPLLKYIRSTTDSSFPSYTPIFNGFPLEEVELSELQSITGRLFVGGSLPEELNLPKLTNAGTCIAQSCTGVKRITAENVTTCTGYSYHSNLISGCPDLEYAYIPNLSSYTVYGDVDGAGSLQDMPKLSHLVIGKAPFTNPSTNVRFALDGCPNLVLLDIRGGLNENIYLDHYNPTAVLSDSERLPIFLSKFKTYIAERLTDNGSGLTLTLSQAVRDAIHAAEATYGIEAIIVTQKGWTLSPAPGASSQ